MDASLLQITVVLCVLKTQKFAGLLFTTVSYAVCFSGFLSSSKFSKFYQY